MPRRIGNMAVGPGPLPLVLPGQHPRNDQTRLAVGAFTYPIFGWLVVTRRHIFQ